MDSSTYLQRIHYPGTPAPSLAELAALQLAHLHSVPFENLDIHLGRPIVLDLARIYTKIVHDGRGGFCYELNGLFAWLLGQLGFSVTLLSAGVARHGEDITKRGAFGPEYDHLTLLVRCPQKPRERWLVDVGFGEGFQVPLSLDTTELQAEAIDNYQIRHEADYHVLYRGDETGSWSPQYRFNLQPRQFTEFAGMCRYHQTSPESSFTHQRVITQVMPGGRVTLSASQELRRLILTSNGLRQEQILPDEAAWRQALLEHFGVSLPQP